MSTQTSAYLEIASQLPENSELTFHDVTWEDYEELREQLEDRPSLHVSYDDGTLTIMSPGKPHEMYTWFFGQLMTAVTLRLGVDVISTGGATQKRRKLKKANEPDASFYVQSAAIIGRRMDMALDKGDPPPDIAVEIDIHNTSIRKLSIYAALGVPEIWRYDGKRMFMYWLKDGQYVSIETSVALPQLSAGVLEHFLTEMREKGQPEALRLFDAWLSGGCPPPVQRPTQ